MASTGGGMAVVGEPDNCEVLFTVDTVEDNENIYTRKAIKYSRSLFETFCEQNHISAVCGGKQEQVFATLDGVLAKFYVEARNRGGKLYSKKTMQSVRFGLQRHFASLYEIDITRHPAFSHSNSMYKYVLKGLKKAGKANVKHRLQITSDDIIRIQTSLQAKQFTAKGLQQKVFLDIVVHFKDLRVSNFRGLKRGDFECHSGAGSGQKFYTLGAGFFARHHKPRDYELSRMYSVTDSKNCPVASLQRYLAKLNPTCAFLWQRPRTNVSEEQAVWYDNTPLGKETLRIMMKTISLEANCSTTYTFHCLRASSLSMLQYYGTKGKEIEGTEDAVQYDIDEDDEDDDDDDGWEMDFGKEDNTDDATMDATFPSDVTSSPVHESKEFLETFIDSSGKNGPEMHKEPDKESCTAADRHSLTASAREELEYFSKDIASSMRRIPEEWWDDVKIEVMTVIRNFSIAATRSAAEGVNRRASLSPPTLATAQKLSGTSSLGRPAPGHTHPWMSTSPATGNSQYLPVQQGGSSIAPATYVGV
ncbi:uncharacterized protein [Diadema antillarum]|uniref:uncharacterized protein n=1 Tax=Diadema antillarum TaxID=105358 RepID=UPI003A8993F0